MASNLLESYKARINSERVKLGETIKTTKLCFLDFEYNNTAEKQLNLVSVAFKIDGISKALWLYNSDKQKESAKSFIKNLHRKGYTFVSWNVEAEASSCISLGINPTAMRWIDLQLEYKMLTNHWAKYRYGKHLVKGKEKRTFCPSLKRELADFQIKKMSFSNPETNLAAGAYKLLGEMIDTERKETVRNIIIANEDVEEHKREILEYNKSDLDYLPEILDKVLAAYDSRPECKISLCEIEYRGLVAADVAVMTRRGYPVSNTVRNFSRSLPKLINELCEDINSQFPEMKLFEWKKKEERFTRKEKPLQEWIKNSGLASKWEKTDSKTKFSLSLEAFEEHFSYRSPYPRNNLPAQIIRYLRFQQSINGFRPTSNKKRKTFYSVYGEDRRARPYLNPYGSQSGRYQPSATGFLPLKSSWMRWFIQPKKGMAITGIDYVSQEYLIGALNSGDEIMYESYQSGDPYYDFAKRTKAVPADSSPKDFPIIRTRYKTTVLAILFFMGPKSLAAQLTDATGEYHSEEDAKKLIDQFERTYRKFTKYRLKVISTYRMRGHLKLNDGWTMFGDNPNFRSIANCGTTQGTGSCILRRAIRKSHEDRLRPIIPLHDALYIEHEIGDVITVDKFYAIMREAFVYHFSDKKRADAIRLDGSSWSREYDEGSSFETPSGIVVPTKRFYLEDRGKSEFEMFSKHFLIRSKE